VCWHGSARTSIKAAESTHHFVERDWPIEIGRSPQGRIAFDSAGIGSPGSQYRALHLGLELWMMDDIIWAPEMGEGHEFASFLLSSSFMAATKTAGQI
jgi:hypothetical protein